MQTSMEGYRAHERNMTPSPKDTINQQLTPSKMDMHIDLMKLREL